MKPMEPKYYQLGRLQSRKDAAIEGTKLCQCYQQTFAGVKWIQDKIVYQMSWAEMFAERRSYNSSSQ